MSKRNVRAQTLLDKIYYNIKSPAYLASLEPLYNEAIKKNRNITRPVVNDYLTKQDVYTRHRKSVKRFKQRKVLQSGIFKQWQIDLAVYISIKKYNKNFQYIMVAIDVFSRKMYATPVKTKHTDSLIEALTVLFKKAGKVPRKIQSDREAGIYAKKTRDFLQKKGVILFSTNNELKASIVERAIRSLKELLQRHMDYHNTKTYVDVLDDVVKVYNSRFHRSIGMAPDQVNSTNSKRVYNYQYSKYLKSKPRKARFSVGDCVRISSYKHRFQKGYEYNFSEELFYISKIHKTNPITYSIVDGDDEEIIGTFYAPELSLYTGKSSKK